MPLVDLLLTLSVPVMWGLGLPAAPPPDRPRLPLSQIAHFPDREGQNRE